MVATGLTAAHNPVFGVWSQPWSVWLKYLCLDDLTVLDNNRITAMVKVASKPRSGTVKSSQCIIWDESCPLYFWPLFLTISLQLLLQSVDGNKVISPPRYSWRTSWNTSKVIGFFLLSHPLACLSGWLAWHQWQNPSCSSCGYRLEVAAERAARE